MCYFIYDHIGFRCWKLSIIQTYMRNNYGYLINYGWGGKMVGKKTKLKKIKWTTKMLWISFRIALENNREWTSIITPLSRWRVMTPVKIIIHINPPFFVSFSVFLCIDNHFSWDYSSQTNSIDYLFPSIRHGLVTYRLIFLLIFYNQIC